MEAKVLGTFHPSQLQSEVIEAELRPLLPECCRRERISVRVPMEGVAGIPHPDNMEWHQDGGGSEGTIKHMVVWATEDPTDLRSSSGELFSFKPYDIIWFDNCAAFHKQPRNTRPLDRWFVSIRCSGELI